MKISRRKSKLQKQRYVEIPLISSDKISDIKNVECLLVMKKLFGKLGNLCTKGG